MKEFVSLIAAEAGDLRYYINFLHYNNIYNYYHSIFRMSQKKEDFTLRKVLFSCL